MFHFFPQKICHFQIGSIEVVVCSTYIYIFTWISNLCDEFCTWLTGSKSFRLFTQMFYEKTFWNGNSLVLLYLHIWHYTELLWQMYTKGRFPWGPHARYLLQKHGYFIWTKLVFWWDTYPCIKCQHFLQNISPRF